MKRILPFMLILLASVPVYSQIIADHTVVDQYDKIPQMYIDEVKKMWVVVAGESHSAGYRTGLNLLAASYPAYTVNVRESGTPDGFTSSSLRFSRGTWGDLTRSSGWIYEYGEEDWWTNSTGISRTKAGITYCNTHNLTLAAIGFGWCWDDTYGSFTATADPVFGVKWTGVSEGSPDGEKAWGLDAGDYAITGNSVSMDTYLSATQDYIDYCNAQGYPTKVFFTTGPVDTYYDNGEAGYQGYLKHEHIRNFVKADASRILFDYADILCFDDNGVQNTVTWKGNIFPRITATNGTPEQTGHISNAGAIRLAKAMWWMLARMAGWDGGVSSVPVTGITVTGAGSATTITTDKGTLQLTAAVLPANATNKNITWSIVNGTGQATISSTGLVTAVSAGTVTARATAADGSGVVGSLVITISGQVIPVTNITVTGAGGATTITADKGTLQLAAAVLPANATNKNVTWSVVNGTGQATISSTGLVTAVSAGTVTARATANDGSGVVGSLVITISGQVIPVTNITVTGAGGATTITADKGTLQLAAAVLPANATNKNITWSVANGTGQATINSTGLVTAVSAGTVTARATANDGSGVVGSLVITISGQVIPVTGITVTGAGGAITITTDKGTLQLTAAVLPANATNKNVTWSIVNGTGQATINASGLVTAAANGTVTARATANDGSGVVGSLVITISGQVIPVTNITVTGAGGATTITTDKGTLQLTAAVLPANATNKNVTWSIVNGTGQATINSTGLVTAVSAGTVTARATANDGSGVVGSLVITISGQVIPVTNITVTGAGGAITITTDKGTLQLTAAVLPANATNKNVTWSVVNGTGQATINASGLVTAAANGTVTARATANDGSGVVGSLVITISGQVTPVTGITVTGAGGATTITTDKGTLQLTAAVLPANATNKNVTWSVVNGTGQATINSTGLVTAVSGGAVTACATATDGSGVSGSSVITISNQTVSVSRIDISVVKGEAAISVNKGTLQMSATIVPSNATNKSVTWSVINQTGQANISATGLLTAVADGIVTVRATANDGSGIYSEMTVAISNQVVAVNAITIAAEGGRNIIDQPDNTLQLTASVEPQGATNKNVVWSVINGTGEAAITGTGLLTAISAGEVLVVATASDGSGITGELKIIIKDKEKLSSVKIIHYNNRLNITVPEFLLPARASLCTLNGSIVQIMEINSEEFFFETSGLTGGVYIVSVYNSSVQDAAKIVVGD